MTFTAIFKKNYYFRIIIKNLTKCNILNTLAFKHYGKFADHNLEKFCPRSLALASRGSVLKKSVPGLGLERCVLDSTFGWQHYIGYNRPGK